MISHNGYALSLPPEQLASGVVDAEEQVPYVDRDEAGAVKQASLTLAALVATWDAVDLARQWL